MTIRNIIHSVVIILTLILCFGYLNKKGFSFSKHMSKPNWESFPQEKSSPEKKIEDQKLDEKKKPKKEEKIEKKPEPKTEPKPEEKNNPDEQIEEKPSESNPQNSKPRLFRRGRFFSDCTSGT